ncbi:MAG: hypothetical protein ABJB66_09735 [Gemmatimonadaceae bacterium]
MTALTYPTTFNYELGSCLSPDEVASELQLLGLLRISGFPHAADKRLQALASKAPFVDSVIATVSATNERRNVDAWLSNEHGDAPRTLIPAASLTTEGVPRFVVALPRDASDALLFSVQRELSSEGADPELRNFLDEILTDELAYIDFDPGIGFAALTAATAPVPATLVCAVSSRASEVLALDAAVESSGVSEIMRVFRNVNGSVTVDVLTSDLLANDMTNDSREIVVYAGIASAVPEVVHGSLNAIRDGRIAAVAWRSSQRTGDMILGDYEWSHEIDNAGTVLGVLGFTHFALAQVDDDVELVPLAAVTGNAIVISLSREYLSRANVS